MAMTKNFMELQFCTENILTHKFDSPKVKLYIYDENSKTLLRYND